MSGSVGISGLWLSVSHTHTQVDMIHFKHSAFFLFAQNNSIWLQIDEWRNWAIENAKNEWVWLGYKRQDCNIVS